MSYKRGLAVVIGCVVAALVSYAATWPRFHPEPAGEPAPGAGVQAKAPSPDAPSSSPVTPPPGSNDPLAWASLNEEQHAALAPFATQWDHFSDERKRKWLKIATRYPKMSPEVQKRLHERMTEWVRMTPQQRRVARENYQVSKELPAQARQRAWEAYQQLPEDQKARLAASERKRRPTVVSAPPSGNKSEIRDIQRLVNERDHKGPHAPGASAPASGAVPASNTGSVIPAPGSPAAAAAAAIASGVPAAGSFVPATPIPVSPAEAPAAYKGS
ncbi:DUF3106 domain-containing protein [Paraburkholderia acidisoli]|uniref:DUF3106 domain-containing protein n=1 Tax=Paraburkholderia acidisoli TaxID=2571748 RepID=A0A7Z2JDW5_9BURK|nr:DUF3106 domain-containing protein [Paraburkholderia acidisoli]QGZ61026.1 DUF3106 domain-containing protein [Paraburkholderia acidisoli]